MAEQTITTIDPTKVDLNNFDFDALPKEFFDKYEASRKGKAAERIVILRKQLLSEEQAHLHGDAELVDSYGKTVVAIATDRQKEGVTLSEFVTVMQPELLRKAIKNLTEHKKVVVLKLHPDGADSGNKKYIYLPDFAPERK